MRSLFAMTVAGLLSAVPALAQVNATAATDLNLRAGPGGEQQIVGVIPSGGEVTVAGCMTDSSWCQVDFQGTTGWAFGDYLTATVPDQPDPVIVIENREPLHIQTVKAPDPGAGAGAVAGAVAAATLVGGPAALLAGAALGAVAGDAVLTPESPEVTYVTTNPVKPVYLGGEVVVGAGIPEEVEVIPVPDSTYSYLYVNGQPVIVDNSNRQIVYVVR